MFYKKWRIILIPKQKQCSHPFFHLKEGREKEDLSVRLRFLASRAGFGCGAVSSFLQRAQASLSTSLMQHMREKLLIGEGLAHQTTHRQILERLLFQQDVHALFIGIQLQDHVSSGKVRRDIIALEIYAHLAIAIHFALQMQPIQRCQPSVWVHRLWQRR
jgi:hypothetical protein